MDEIMERLLRVERTVAELERRQQDADEETARELARVSEDLREVRREVLPPWKRRQVR